MPLWNRFLLATLSAVAFLSSCGGGDGPTDTLPPSLPEVTSFTATPTPAVLGAPVTLAWTTIRATTCSINGGVGSVPCNGNIVVNPQGPTTYTLSAASEDGSSTETVSVALLPPTLAAVTPAQGLAGTSFELSLTGTGFATSTSQVTIEGNGVTTIVVDVVDGNTVSLTVTLAADAQPGERALRVTTVAGTSNPIPFTILPIAPPVVQEVSPDSGAPASTVAVTVTGTGFVAGATTLEVSGGGITVENVQVLPSPAPQAIGVSGEHGVIAASATSGSLQAELVIAEEALPGVRQLTVTTPGGSSDPVPFTLTAPAGSGILEIATGSDHTCAILAADGSTWCFGYGTTGGLGGGVFEHSSDPVRVSGNHDFVRLYGGNLNSCGVTTSGEAWCWGSGASGRLGNGSTENSAIPVPVSGGITFSQIAPGLAHTCGIATDGTGWCWGSNSSGRLGDGSTASSLVPVQVSGGHTFISIATSPSGPHSCGVRPDGVALCWGSGSLGTGPDNNSSSLVPVEVAGGHTFSSITIGNSASCGLTTAGAALCWGIGSSGRLGNGSTDSSPTPVAVVGGHQFTQISGSHNGAFCALSIDGQILCWGSGSNYRLGNGSLDNRNTPTPVAGDHTFTSVGLGGSHGCGRTVDGKAWCWGFGSLGRLGNGETSDQPTPVEVRAGPFGDG